jgi:hypothetical protein
MTKVTGLAAAGTADGVTLVVSSWPIVREFNNLHQVGAKTNPKDLLFWRLFFAIILRAH